MIKEDIIIIIDNGHGINTPGKCSPDKSLLEWKYTREIAQDVVDFLKGYGYNAVRIVTEDKDISLSERVKRTNKLLKDYKAGLFISVHCNAAGHGEWMSGTGWEAWTTKGQNNSDKLAQCLYERAKVNFPDKKIRTDKKDGDDDKEANFTVIYGANCPAVLTENFFMDNKEDLKFMQSEMGRHAIIRTHVEGVIDFINKYYLKK